MQLKWNWRNFGQQMATMRGQEFETTFARGFEGVCSLCYVVCEHICIHHDGQCTAGILFNYNLRRIEKEALIALRRFTEHQRNFYKCWIFYSKTQVCIYRSALKLYTYSPKLIHSLFGLFNSTIKRKVRRGKLQLKNKNCIWIMFWCRFSCSDIMQCRGDNFYRCSDILISYSMRLTRYLVLSLF